MDNALIYDDPVERCLAAIIGQACKDYVVARMRGFIDENGYINEVAVAQSQGQYTLKPNTLLGCDRTEIRTAWLFIHGGGLDFFMEALSPGQSPDMIRDNIQQVLENKKEIVWK